MKNSSAKERIEILENLVKTLETYRDLLSLELDELATIATIHG